MGCCYSRNKNTTDTHEPPKEPTPTAGGLSNSMENPRPASQNPSDPFIIK